MFVDESREAVKIVKENLKTCGMSATVMQTDARSFLRSCGSFDLIFVDPPYDSDLYGEVLEIINSVDILSDGGIIICEALAKLQSAHSAFNTMGGAAAAAPAPVQQPAAAPAQAVKAEPARPQEVRRAQPAPGGKRQGAPVMKIQRES